MSFIKLWESLRDFVRNFNGNRKLKYINSLGV